MTLETMDTTQAAAALATYAGADDSRGVDEQIADLVTDLLHVAVSRDVDPAEVLRRVDRDATAEGVLPDYIEARRS